jgi:hypothetical protein
MIVQSATAKLAARVGARNPRHRAVTESHSSFPAPPSTEITTMLFAVALLGVLAAAPADSLPGTWQITGDVAGNPLNEVCTIARAESKLSGVCKNQEGKDYPLFGEVKGDTITFEHGGDYQGQEIRIIYTGTLASPKQLKGTVEVKPYDVSGEFTAAPTAPIAPTAAPAPAPAAAPAKP